MIRTNRARWSALLATAAVAALSSGAGAWAQTATAPSAEDNTLTEILVTARKKEENLQSVPVAVTNIGGEQLEEQGIRTPTDLSRVVPSLTVSPILSSQSAALFSLRGQVGGDVLLSVSQAIGLYEDGVNIPHPVGTNAAFFDLARLEVLKGPQGTLYGRNTTGGAVNILTRGGDYRGFHGFLALEAGNYNHLKYAGAVNVPIIEDQLAARIAYQHWDREGYGKSLVTGQKMGGDHDDDIVRVSLQADPTDYLSAVLKAEYIKLNQNGQFSTPRAVSTVNPYLEAGLETPGGLQALGGPAGLRDPAAVGRLLAIGRNALNPYIDTGDIFTNSQELRQFDKLEAYHLVADINWDITDNVRLRSITGWHSVQDFQTLDIDATPFQILEISAGAGGGVQPLNGPYPLPLYPDQEYHQVTQEINLSGDYFDGKLDWLVGAFVSADDGKGGTVNTPFVALQGISGQPAASGTLATEVDTDTWALFTQNDIHLSDKVTVTLGARYTEERVSNSVSAFGFFPQTQLFTCVLPPQVGPAPGNFPLTCNADASAKFSGTSYLASFNYQVTPDTLVYLKTARGFRGGALQPRRPDYPAASPEIATDYELGFKSDFFDRRLRTNLAVYQTNYDNKQQSQVVAGITPGTSSTVIVNSATARIRGFEAEVTAMPIEGLSIYGSLTWLEGQFLSYPNALTPNSVPATPCTTCVNGSGLPFADPNWRYSIGGRYEFDAGPGRLALQADWAWRDKSDATVLTEDLTQPKALRDEFREARGLLNGRIDYDLEDKGLTLSLFGTNLLDEHYQGAGVPGSALGITTGATREPRMWGVSVRKTFGDE